MQDSAQQFDTKLEVLSGLLSAMSPEQVLPITPQGSSMFPFFMGNRDVLYIARVNEPLKRGDIALYRRDDGTYVVHRVYRVKTGSPNISYFMLGDHQTWIEGPLSEKQILGVVKYYERKNKKIVCSENVRYRLLWNIWLLLRPVRPLLLKIWSIRYRIKTRKI